MIYDDKERQDIIDYADDLIAKKDKETDNLSEIKRCAYYGRDQEIADLIVKHAQLTEKNFLSSKNFVLYSKSNENDICMKKNKEDIKIVGSVETMKTYIEKNDAGIWKLHLPPMPSIKVRHNGTSGQYMHNVITNLINSTSDLEIVDNPVVCFIHHISKNRPSTKYFDADNLDSKKALDGLQGKLIGNDNLLSIRTYQQGVISDEEFCDLYVMPMEIFPNWLLQQFMNSKSKN